MIDQLHMILYDLLHVVIGILKLYFHCAFPILLIQECTGLLKQCLFLFKFLSGMIPDDIICHCPFNISIQCIQMVEALIFFRIHRVFRYRQHSLEFHGSQQCILHFVLGVSRMHTSPMEGYPGTCRIEILIFQLPKLTAIHRIGTVC